MSAVRSAYLAPSNYLPAGAHEPRPLRWSYRDYIRVHELGIFKDRRVELIEGRIIEMAPIGPRHFVATNLVDVALRRICPDGYFVSSAPVLKLGESGPQPDVVIVQGPVKSYSGGVPTSAALIVEVSDTTLEADRLDKGSLYAKSGISDYWILNLVENVLEVHRDPVIDPLQPSGFRYATVERFAPGSTASPLVASDQRVIVSELLP